MAISTHETLREVVGEDTNNAGNCPLCKFHKNIRAAIPSHETLREVVGEDTNNGGEPVNRLLPIVNCKQ